MKKTLNKTTNGHIIFLSFLLILGTVMVSNNIIDPDFLWHVKNGEWMITNHQIIKTSIGSYFNNPYVDHEWLFDIFIYIIYNSFGYIGCKVFSVICMMIGIILIYRYVSRKIKYKYLFMFNIFFMYVNLSFSFESRPQVMSYIITIIILILIDNNCKYFQYIIPILFCILANIHGGIIPQTILLIFIYLIAELFEFLLYNKTIDKNYIVKIFITLILSFFTSLINPNTYEIYTYTIKMFQTQYTLKVISEWQSPLKKQNVFYSIYLLLPMSFLMLSNKHKNIKDFLFVCFGTLGAILYNRFIVLHTILFLIFGYQYFDNIIAEFISNKNINFKYKNKLKISFSPFIIFIFLSFFIFQSNKVNINNSLINTKIYPTKTIDYIKNNNIDINNNILFHDFSIGGYLIFNNYKSFIDGRTDPFMKEFCKKPIYEDQLNLLNNKDNNLTTDLINKYNIKYILIKKSYNLNNYLNYNSNWQLIYKEDNFVLYKKL